MKFKCSLCGYEWNSRKEGKVPVSCPRCKRYDWREKTTTATLKPQNKLSKDDDAQLNK